MKRSGLQNGFSILEFTVSMAVLVLLFVATMSLFVPLLKRSKTEGGISQSQIEGVIGLELLRTDIVHAGHGLPWTLNDLAYSETVAAPGDVMNDFDGVDSHPPRAIASVNNATDDTPDRLTIKANNVDSVDEAAQKISYIQRGDGNVYHTWGDPNLDFAGTEYISVLRLVDPSTGIPLQLQAHPTAPTQFYMRANEIVAPPATGFANEIWYMFGLNSTVQPRMPFNRADYFVDFASAPDRCADDTGVLLKAMVSQVDGSTLDPTYPLLDCVADFQVAYGIDTETFPDGKIDCVTNNLANIPAMSYADPELRASKTRERVREVRVYVLAQEGVFDNDYDFTSYNGISAQHIMVGETNNLDCTSEPTVGEEFDLRTLGASATYHKDFRWKVYRFVVHPENLSYSLIGAAQGAK